ncbi:hypothetical protein KY289_011805 [Solanum tuberosum]|nr:hypothetical protein KY289_011805 [Solanum tuberosum]
MKQNHKGEGKGKRWFNGMVVSSGGFVVGVSPEREWCCLMGRELLVFAGKEKEKWVGVSVGCSMSELLAGGVPPENENGTMSNEVALGGCFVKGRRKEAALRI